MSPVLAVTKAVHIGRCLRTISFPRFGIPFCLHIKPFRRVPHSKFYSCKWMAWKWKWKWRQILLVGNGNGKEFFTEMEMAGKVEMQQQWTSINSYHRAALDIIRTMDKVVRRTFWIHPTRQNYLAQALVIVLTFFCGSHFECRRYRRYKSDHSPTAFKEKNKIIFCFRTSPN